MPAVDRGDKTLEEYLGESVREGCGWEVVAGVIERVRRTTFSDEDDGEHSYKTINQLTVNRYAPGEGIGSHVDTPSAFGDGLISISLGSGIVMEFNCVQEETKGLRKQVFLPPRSLLLMSKEARYSWEHMIVSRMTDTIDGEVVRRGTRVSLTLRTALDKNGSPMACVESHSFPPCWGNPNLLSPLATPDCERNHVHAVYDAIATQWHHTRGKRGVLWPGATQFLQKLPPGSVVADVGCGDGKYFPAIWEAGSYVIGTDISLPLLETATSAASLCDEGVPESRRVSEPRRHLRNRPAIAVADCMSVPLRTGSCDAAICIAVMHHLSNESRRRRCIEELVRIVKPGSLINIQAWAMTQEEGSRRRFASNDVYVPFNAQPRHLKLQGDTINGGKGRDTSQDESIPKESISTTAKVYSKSLNADYDEEKGLVVFKRYCHLYRQGELDSIALSIPNVVMIESGFESGNFFVIVKKTG
jgi:alkylated DNA repair protein alkB family protein 8